MKFWLVGEEEFKKIKLLYNAKCCDAIAKVVGRCFLRKEEYSRFCWKSHDCQEHSTNLRISSQQPSPRFTSHWCEFLSSHALFFFSANLLCSSIVIVPYTTMATMWGERLLEKRLSPWMDEKAEWPWPKKACEESIGSGVTWWEKNPSRRFIF